MAKRIIVVIMVVLIILGITSYAYSHYRDRRVESGEVVDEGGTVVGSNGSAPVRTPTRSDATDSGSDDAPGPQSRRTAFSTSSPTTVLPMQSSMNSAPVTDTISPNPPNGTVFAGTGKYQVYRQGDLTWRVNTADGTTCILFATEEQWRRPVVYRNACPRG